ncbi:MAG: serine/threonine protein kinase [Planctomycetes bacterium]|nr:serine/threonine protein kinase [Planctomycetota bacterium]
MNLEELIEAHLAGESPTVPTELGREFELAIAAHEALRYALGETVIVPETGPDDRPPPVLPEDYEIIRELGRGGMGVVYLVRQKSLGRMVALKVLRPGEMTFGPLVRRFLDEARHLARLRHPNIVSIHEIGQAADEPYFTMDYVEGESLSAVLARERLSPSRALAILKQAAAGVGHAHKGGIIHRDLKPSNILIDAEGCAYVTDFGLARDMTRTSELTRSGEVLGTPAYMAPEQAQGDTDRIGETTDVHALGVILYEMLTRKPPYGRDAPANILVRLLKEEAPAPRRIDRRVPRDLETICLKAMAKAPEERYPTVRAFLEDIRRFESGEPVQARRPGPVRRAARHVRRRWKVAAAMAGTAFFALLLGALFFGKDVEEMIAAGDEHHALGKHREAEGIYRRALLWPSKYRHLIVLERIFRCCVEAGDRERAVEAALETLGLDPGAWFGELNHAVAMVLASRIRYRQPGSSDDRRLLELAEKRLEMALAGPDLSVTERGVGDKALVEICAALGKEPYAHSGEGAVSLPPGAPDELLRRAAAEGTTAKDRILFAYAAGVGFEKSGDSDAALAAYRQAFEAVRSAHPVYAGLTSGSLHMARPRSLESELENCHRLRRLARAIERLDPQASALLRGGLRFRITGLDLPPDLALNHSVTLSGVAGDRAAQPLTGSAPVQLDQTSWVGVADGRYRLEVRRSGSGTNFSTSRGARANYIFPLLHLDDSSLPQEVEIGGQVVDLEIRARLLEEIDLLGPREGAEVDLESEIFRWTAVPGAAYYEMRLEEVEDRPGGGRYFHSVLKARVEDTGFSPGNVPAAERAAWRALPAGRAAVWNVEAFDASGQSIGKAPERPCFRVKRGWSAD